MEHKHATLQQQLSQSVVEEHKVPIYQASSQLVSLGHQISQGLTQARTNIFWKRRHVQDMVHHQIELS